MKPEWSNLATFHVSRIDPFDASPRSLNDKVNGLYGRLLSLSDSYHYNRRLPHTILEINDILGLELKPDSLGIKDSTIAMSNIHAISRALSRKYRDRPDVFQAFLAELGTQVERQNINIMHQLISPKIVNIHPANEEWPIPATRDEMEEYQRLAKQHAAAIVAQYPEQGGSNILGSLSYDSGGHGNFTLKEAKRVTGNPFAKDNRGVGGDSTGEVEAALAKDYVRAVQNPQGFAKKVKTERTRPPRQRSE